VVERLVPVLLQKYPGSFLLKAPAKKESKPLVVWSID
jgi:hypothetical protein